MVTMTFAGCATSMPDVSAIRGTSLVPSRPASANATPASDIGAFGSWMIPRSLGALSCGTIPVGNVGFELEHASSHIAPRIAHVVRNTDARFMCTPCGCESPYRAAPLARFAGWATDASAGTVPR